MRIALLGFNGPLAQATRKELQARGHEVTATGPECVIFFPGSSKELESLVIKGGFRRLILRSHAFAYGSHAKNPGFIGEERTSLLPQDAPDQSWLTLEQIAFRFPMSAAVRLTNVLDPGEGDLLINRLVRPIATILAGHDPNVQFISVRDAARALTAAAESDAVGLLNVAAPGVIPLKKTLKAAGVIRLPIPRPFFRLLGNHRIDQLQYNWAVSTERAASQLGFQSELSSSEALREFLEQKPGTHPERLLSSYDDWGLDLEYINAWNGWFWLLRNVYWRIESEGLENIPEQGRAMFVSNHRGFMPLDAVMHLYLVRRYRRRIIRFLIIPSLLKLPYLCNFLTKLGGVIASQDNATRLFDSENLVGVFPEGIRGAFTPYRSAYRLRDFAKSAFARMAIENQAPIVPVAVVGHAEIFPIIGRIDWHYVTREYGWPYFPIAPFFPLAPVPLPSKWHVRVLEPVTMEGLKPSDAENSALVREFSRYIQGILQTNIDEMMSRRLHIFWGRFLDGRVPPRSPFRVPEKAQSVAPPESADSHRRPDGQKTSAGSAS